MIDFRPVPGAGPSAGLVLRVGEPDQGRYLRLTHVFLHSVYSMWIGEPARARYARRPARMPLETLEELAATPGAAWGHVTLPPALSDPPPKGSMREDTLDSAWDLVQPLVESFGSETALSRSNFTSLIEQRAQATKSSFVTLRRMLLRYYYFGGTRFALLYLPRGSKPGEKRASLEDAEGRASRPEDGDAADGTTADEDAVVSGGGFRPPLRRRGRQPILSDERGRVEFVASEYDVVDILDSLKRQLRNGVVNIPKAHDEYMKLEFRLRNPEVHAEYMSGKLLPLTVRQYRYYVNTYARLDEDLARNLRRNERSTGYLGSLYARGPGEVYEIDSTGGRLFLVSHDDPPIDVGKPTIYLIIDRWSRFVVAAYLSLKPPSYEEVRHVLLVAFTSRKNRFQALKVDTDDERWPIGRMPAVLCPDRGSDFLSESMEQSVVRDLRIELTPLPPFCPDGKAIVERLIREVKRRMASSGMKGTYADRPLDPKTKRVAREVQSAAVHSLSEAYRCLIEIIVDHNTRPHKTLRQWRELTQANVEPTPLKAYLWGLKHITGLRSPPFSDDDYRRMLLATDSGSIASGVVRYRSRAYLPTNEAAIEMARHSTAKAKAVVLRLDKTDPREVAIARKTGTWATFAVKPGAAAALGGLTLDEEEAFAGRNARLWARAEDASTRKRIAKQSQRGGRPKSVAAPAPPLKVDRQRQLDAREEETAVMKVALGARTPVEAKQVEAEAPAASDWKAREETRRLKQLAVIRQHLKKL